MIINLLFQYGSITREGMLLVGAFIVALLAAIILHEIAHGLSAYAFGDNTAKLMGRLSLNPAKHFDLIGLLMMLFAGFGWAKPVPINVNNFKHRRTGMLVVSIAGVFTNLLLALLFSLFYVLLGGASGQIVHSANGDYFMFFLWAVCYMMVVLNINFALFNLLPLFPLDGYRFLSCFVRQENRFMLFLRRYSLYIVLGLLVLNYIPFVNNFSPLRWYIGEFGGLIMRGFTSLWGLIV